MFKINILERKEKKQKKGKIKPSNDDLTRAYGQFKEHYNIIYKKNALNVLKIKTL